MLMNLINNGVITLFDMVALGNLGYEFIIEGGKVTNVKKAVSA